MKSAFLLACLFVSGFSASAAERSLPSASQTGLEQNRLAVGPVYFYLNYHEIFETADLQSLNPHITRFIGEPKSAEYGSVIGIGFEYARTFLPIPIKVTPGFTFLVGPGNTYDGSSQIPDSTPHDTLTFSPAMGTKNNFFWFNRLAVSYLLEFHPATLELGAGITFSLWERRLFYMSETYTWFNVPLELRGTMRLNRIISVSLNMAYAPMFDGSMNIVQAVPPGHVFNAGPVDLGNRFAYTGGSTLHLRLNPLTGLTFSLFAQGYRFGKSNTMAMTETDENGVVVMNGRYFEPESETDNFGFSIKVTFFPGSTRRP